MIIGKPPLEAVSYDPGATMTTRTRTGSPQRKLIYLLATTVPIGALVVCAAAAPPKKTAKTPPAKTKPAAPASSFEKDVLPLIQKNCVSCHGADSPAADIKLVGFKTGTEALKARALWEKVAANVSLKHMPPAGSPMPTQAERDKLVGWIESTLSKADCELKDPGRVTMRRLNRAEYNNTVRDLLGVDINPAEDFPSDDVGYGFDNIGDVLSISPLHMEKYLAAARKVAQATVIAPEDRIAVRGAKFDASKLQGDGGDYGPTNGRLLFSNGAVGAEYDFPAAGEYDIFLDAFEQHAGPKDESARVALQLGGKVVRNFQVRAREANPGHYPTRVTIAKPGKQRVAVAFLNDYYDDKNPDPKLRGDRNLVVQSIEVVPQGLTVAAPKEPPLSQRRLVKAYPASDTEVARDAATRQVVTPFLPRAWRRPVTKDEVDRIVRIAALGRRNGGSYEKGLQVALQASLASPNFLFRVETNAANTNPKVTRQPLNDYELATRLSYFLWSSMPDEQLLALAAEGRLKNPTVLVAQAQRMLKDPRARALTDNFGAQWLNLRKINNVTPDQGRFKDFNEPMRVAMRTETELYFNGIVQENRSILEFLDSNYTYLNENLARHYGNTEIKGPDFRRVVLKSGRRGGVLTQASILTLTSNPTRTSPVKRGKWVLENILGTPPPPPPPGVAEIPEDKKGETSGATLRQKMEKHRENPACASCHQRMDPIGFGLENFDAVGAWRDVDGGAALDVSGELPDGAKFNGPIGLKKYLSTKKTQFTRTFTERLLTYALGRGVESTDRCNLDTMAATVAKEQYKFSSVVAAIVTSEPFRLRHADTPVPTPKPTPGAVKAASQK
jgi:mono/diheme cytochrome c family protein